MTLSFEPRPGVDAEHDAYRKRVNDFRARRVESCEHEWQPVSMRFETQSLDAHGGVLIRQPDLERGRVYCVCMKCYGHTYAETRWAGYYLALDGDPAHGGDDDAAHDAAHESENAA